MLIGTSFGTSGTLGVILLILARSGNVPSALAAGAVISGAMLGDRGSPVSSSCNLVAGLTGTDERRMSNGCFGKRSYLC